MPSTRLGVLVILLRLAPAVAVGQASSEATSPQTRETIAPQQHRPRYVAPGTRPPFFDPIRNVTVSYNTIWAGYAVTGSGFTQVQGSWIVTAVDCTKTPNTDSSEWVGIDGWSSNTVEQTGTDADCNGKTLRTLDRNAYKPIAKAAKKTNCTTTRTRPGSRFGRVCFIPSDAAASL
ncbi:MAG: G1 family glutamic endopeptidase [Candidatus Sulfotelmatobacter sp.]